MIASFDPSGSQTGRVYDIDHFVCNTEDVARWAEFNRNVLGAVEHPEPAPGIFQSVGRIRIGAFKARARLPRSLGLGRGAPRYGYYIRKADVGRHVECLAESGATYREPIYGELDGAIGTSIAFQDPDENQFEFWAPDVPPPGALADLSSTGVGRISHAVFESRDLERTAAFFRQYCELSANDMIAEKDTLVLPLAGGGRIIYKQVETLGARTAPMGLVDSHTALSIPEPTYFANYRRLWASLPEWDYNIVTHENMPDHPETLPPRTVRHYSPEGVQFFKAVGRGDDFLDWDANMFHFVGAVPRGDSLAEHDAFTLGTWATAWESEHGTIGGFKEAVLGELG